MRRDNTPEGSICTVDFDGGGQAVVTGRGARLTRLDLPGVTDEQPLLWTGDVRSGLGVSGVVPVYPWFAGGRRKNKRPVHGLAAGVDWEMERMVDHGSRPGDRQEIMWSLDHDDLDADLAGERRARFAARADYSFAGRHASGDAAVTMRLQVSNLGDNVSSQAVGVLAAIRVGDADQCWISGLSGHECSDLDGIATHTQVGHLPMTLPVTHLFEAPGESREHRVELHDRSLERTTILTGSSAREAFVWRPEGAPEFVVLGFVNRRRHVVRLTPGQTFSMGFTIAATPSLSVPDAPARPH